MPIRTSRRQLLKLGALATGSLATPVFLRRAWAQEPFTVRVPGGYGDIWDVAFFKPFEAATGIKATGVISKDFPFNEFKISVETGAYRWSMAGGITKDLYFRLKDASLIDRIDVSAPSIADRPAESVHEEWLPYALFCFAIAYRDTSYPQGLSSFRDMWNVADFPGRRALRNRATDAIETTARGIGIPVDQIYATLQTPDGLDKVFEGLSEIRPSIAIWWEADPQLEQLIGSGDLDIFPINSHRIQKLKNEGAPVAINYTDGYYTSQGWAIPKGSPQAEVAREFISFAAQPDREAELMKSTLMGPMHPKAFDYLDAELAKTLPTYPENLSKMREQDAQFWLTHGEALNTRFEQWLLNG